MKTDFYIMEEDIVKAHIMVNDEQVKSEIFPDPEGCSKFNGDMTLDHIQKFLLSRFYVAYVNINNKTAQVIRFAGFTQDTEPFILDNLHKNNGVSMDDTTWIRFSDQSDLKWEDVMYED